MYHKLTCFNDVALIPALKTLKILTTRAIVWRGTVNFACLIFFITHHGQLAPWSFWNPKLHAISKFKTLTGLELAMMGDKKNQACVYRQTMRSTFPLLILIVLTTSIDQWQKSLKTSILPFKIHSFLALEVNDSAAGSGPEATIYPTVAFTLKYMKIMRIDEVLRSHQALLVLSRVCRAYVVGVFTSLIPYFLFL